MGGLGGMGAIAFAFPVFTWVNNVTLDCGARFTQRMDLLSATSASSHHVIGHEVHSITLPSDWLRLTLSELNGITPRRCGPSAHINVMLVLRLSFFFFSYSFPLFRVVRIGDVSLLNFLFLIQNFHEKTSALLSSAELLVVSLFP